MRVFRTLLPLMLIATMFIATSCKEDTPIQPVDNKPHITLDTTSMQVANKGGEYEVGYTLTNAIKGLGLVAQSDDSWITILSSDNGKIIFDVGTNLTEERRTGTIELKYPNIEQLPKIMVTQEAGGALFTLTVEELTSTRCVTKVVPADDTMAYIVYSSQLSYFHQAGITTAEELYEDDYLYFKSFAEQYDAVFGQFLLMNDIAFIGESLTGWTGLTPGEELVIYVYGISFSNDMTHYTLATPVYHTIVTIPYPELSEVAFDVDIEVSGPEIWYTFAPRNWNGYYSFEIFAEGDGGYVPEGTEVDSEITQAFALRWLNMINPLMQQGYDAQELMRLMCLKGPDNYNEIRMADTGYMIAFYAVDIIDGVPQMCSRPELFYFRTEPVTESDMSFDINVENNYVRVADVTITPTTDDPYTIALIQSDLIPEGKSNSEIIDWLTGNYKLSLFSGTVYSHINTLEPSTEYSILVFGYYGGIVTTDLYRYDFGTEEESECENSVLKIEWAGPYSPKELAQADPENYGHIAMYEDYGFYMMWMEVFTEYPTPDIFHLHYEATKLESMGEEGIFKNLISYSYTPTQVVAARSGIEFIMCGVTMDYRGNYSDMWISEPFSYDYTPETKRPIEELLERTSSTRGGKLVMVGCNATGDMQVIPVL